VELFSGMVKANKSAHESTVEESKTILTSAVESLQRRWVEVSIGSDFISVFKIIGFLNDETKSKIEDRAVEMVQGFNAAEMRKVGRYLNIINLVYFDVLMKTKKYSC